jgi:hypothetical protein
LVVVVVVVLLLLVVVVLVVVAVLVGVDLERTCGASESAAAVCASTSLRGN